MAERLRRDSKCRGAGHTNRAQKSSGLFFHMWVFMVLIATQNVVMGEVDIDEFKKSISSAYGNAGGKKSIRIGEGGAVEEVEESSETEVDRRAGKEEEVDTAEEESKIESFVQGKHAFNIENDYEEALKHFISAEESLSQIEEEKLREAVARSIRFYKAKSLFELGRFSEAANEAMRMQRLEGESIALFKKAMSYQSLSSASSEKEITEALKESNNSPYLLKLRADMRIKKGQYNRALEDIKVLGEAKSQRKTASRLQMHCDFLLGRYASGLSLLSEMKDCAFLYKKAKAILAKYDAIGHRLTAANYRNLKKLLDTDILVAKALDTKFKPSIFNRVRKDAMKRFIRVAKGIGKKKEALEYSTSMVKTAEDLSEEEYAEHIELLIAMNRFQSAEKALNTYINTESPLFEKLKTEYNVHAKKVRAEQEKKKKEQKKKEEEDLKKSVKEAQAKEKERCERRKKFVASRRGKVYDPEGFYKFFGLPNKSSEKAITGAYNKFARKSCINRGKKNSSTAEQAKKDLIIANKAKEVLLNADKKEEYDSGLYMTEKEKETWGYNDELVERYEKNGGQQEHHTHDLFDILLNSGFGRSFGGGFGGGDFGGGFGGGRRVVYYM
ncbi:hypothetical protein NECID01_1078 [Nematocida sp. AWRm77]|nr:hypothetical protein NECID01_1078 [Nematocida sp. AWRm77]